MTNPLLTDYVLPEFFSIEPIHIFPAVQKTLNEYRQTVENILSKTDKYTWENLCTPLEIENDKYNKVWSTVSHLYSVKNTQELRKAYEKCLPLISEFHVWISHYQPLYHAYQLLKKSNEYTFLSQAQRKSIKNKLRDFELSGISLPLKKQQRYGEIVAKISEITSKFSNNILDATMGWSKFIKDKKLLSGMPENALIAAKIMAKDKNKEGYLFTLDIPSYLPVMTYADNAQLRREMSYAFNTRASDQGPNAGKWDNSKLIDELVALRHELAQLLGFKNFAYKSLSTKMAESPQQVLSFLNALADRAYQKGQKEFSELEKFAKEHYAVDKLEFWDLAYYSEKQKQHKFSLNNEELRFYFPEPRVIKGLFEVVYRIYGLTIQERKNVETWHPDVRFFELYDDKNVLYGSFYFDLYARENKRDGAWMADCVGRMVYKNIVHQKPVAYLTCNFNKPLDKNPALFTHDEVITLFHEFGHALHHIVTKVDVADVAGINGVPWDAVELPSQLMENWCWEPEALQFISGHYKTSHPLPCTMLDSMLSSKNYQSGMFILRQLECALFDFYLHAEYNSVKGAQVMKTLNTVKEKVSVIISPEWNRFPHAFSHIFSGGYAAGYYSYLWADVLAADAYSRFRDEGIFNQKTGKSFLNNILSLGGSEEPMVLFKRFRGRKPKLDAMLSSYDLL
ncbi:Oligopeptidase A [Candidatus Hartigia pinicola]|nr:Oligopeptidase A [Candidatus Hartigia pinicola]